MGSDGRERWNRRKLYYFTERSGLSRKWNITDLWWRISAKLLIFRNIFSWRPCMDGGVDGGGIIMVHGQTNREYYNACCVQSSRCSVRVLVWLNDEPPRRKKAAAKHIALNTTQIQKSTLNPPPLYTTHSLTPLNKNPFGLKFMCRDETETAGEIILACCDEPNPRHQ